MISGNLAEEGRLLLHSIFWGMLFMATYDAFRVFRGLVRHSVVAINIEDYLYWVAVGLTAFLLLLKENDGIIRWYVIGGIGGGMLLFSLGISRFTVPVLIWVLQGVGKTMTRTQKKFTKTVEKIKKLF